MTFVLRFLRMVLPPMWLHLRSLGGRGHRSGKGVSSLSLDVSPSLPMASCLFGRIRLALIAIATLVTFSTACVAFAVRLIVTTSTSVASVASVAFVGALCTSLAVAIAVVAITAVVVDVAMIRATTVASSVLAKLLASHFCLRPCLLDVAAIVVVLACALFQRRRSRSLRPTFMSH
jgi:hypothetical protein